MRTETFKIGLGPFETEFVTSLYPPYNVEVRRGARTIDIPLPMLLAFVADRVRKQKIYDLQIMGDNDILGLEREEVR